MGNFFIWVDALRMKTNSPKYRNTGLKEVQPSGTGNVMKGLEQERLVL